MCYQLYFCEGIDVPRKNNGKNIGVGGRMGWGSKERGPLVIRSEIKILK